MRKVEHDLVEPDRPVLAVLFLLQIIKPVGPTLEHPPLPLDSSPLLLATSDRSGWCEAGKLPDLFRLGEVGPVDAKQDGGACASEGRDVRGEVGIFLRSDGFGVVCGAAEERRGHVGLNWCGGGGGRARRGR